SSTYNLVSIEISELLPVSFSPLFLASIFNPVRIGIVVLLEIANCTSRNFFNNSTRFTVNFILSAPLLILFIFYSIAQYLMFLCFIISEFEAHLIKLII